MFQPPSTGLAQAWYRLTAAQLNKIFTLYLPVPSPFLNYVFYRHPKFHELALQIMILFFQQLAYNLQL